MNTAIVGLGSNIQPQKNIQKAKKILDERFKILRESKFVSTKPVGLADQADFVNGVLLITTGLKLDQLRSQLKGIEQDLGRPPGSFKYGPRTIDLDILVWNGKVVDEDFYKRDFIRKSVLELSVDVKHPKDDSQNVL